MNTLPGRSTLPALLRCAFLVLFAGTLSCGGGGSGGGGDPTVGAMSGSISVLGTASTVLEQEPNDTPSQANSLGQLVAGQTVTILGTTTDDGSDPFDSFLFDAPQPIQVTATLSFDPALDFDFLLYDPATMQIVTVFETTNVPEVGTFQWNGPFILALYSFQGAGSYSFEISASAPVSLPAGDGGPHHLGWLAAGERRELSGTGTQRLRFSLPQGTLLGARAPGAHVDLLDATADPRAPVPAASPLEAPAGESRARFGARSLVELLVSGEASGSPWELEVEALALAPGALPPAASTPLALEARDLRRPPARPFGAPWPAVPGELIVQVVEHEPFEAQLAEEGAEVVRGNGNGFARLVRVPLPPALEGEEALRSTLAAGFVLGSRPGIAAWAPNHVHQAQQVTPNDAFYSYQWHYPQIHLPAAWEITTGSSNVIVAVLDTGSSNHPDLVNRLIPGYDFISDPANAGHNNGINPDATDPGDGNGLQPSSFHGTHVAGTIGADTNNGIGVAGVTWATGIMPLRVLGLFGGTDYDIGQAVRFAAGLPNDSGTVPPQRADVMNLSLGGPGSSQVMQNLYTEARNQGVTIFAAAGNNNSSTPFFPAAYSGVISVSAVDIQGEKAPYSNFHATVDLAAPGGNVAVDLNGDGYGDGVLSTKIDDGVFPPQPVFAFEQGTSMACPHAAGVAALMLAVNPALTPTQVQAILESTATDLGAPGKDPIFGHGLINAHAAVLAASGAGGGNPFLSVSTESLNFGNNQTQIDVQIANGGGGTLEVDAPIVSAPPNGTWLAASLGAAGSANTNASSVRVTVNRANLSPASYFGTVTLNSNGGTRVIQVLMSVGAGDPLPNVTIFVLAVDAFTFETRGQVVINPAITSLSYSFPALPPGVYYLAAGSDDDDDGFICGPGDVYCGLYPALNQPLTIQVSPGQTIMGLDFPVVSDFNSSLGAGGPARAFAVLEVAR